MQAKSMVAAAVFAFATINVIPVSAKAQQIMSSMGGVCIDAEGGARNGARLVGYPCHSGANQRFEFVNGSNTRLRVVGTDLCAASDSRNQGSQIRLRPCEYGSNGNHLQNFGVRSRNMIGHNTGYVVDLSGGWGGRILSFFPGQLQPLVLWGSHGADNQRWYRVQNRRYANYKNVPDGAMFAVPGMKGTFMKQSNQVLDASTGALIGLDGASLIGLDGASLIGLDGASLR
jgi:hypothetical protein